MTGKMREWKTFGWYFLIALVAEVISFRWTWESAPTDSLRVIYEGSFWAYEAEGIIPWLICFTLLGLLRIIRVRKD